MKEEEESNEDVVSPPPNSPPSDSNCLAELVLDDDPGLWPKVVSDCKRCAMGRRGPVQIKTDFPKNADDRRFTCSNYYIFMKNGEKIIRSWLVYSKAKNCVLCFCCRLFGDGSRPTHLSYNGFNN